MKVLFLSYNGLLEPILPSQAIPYLKDLAKIGHEFILLTYEKKSDLDRAGHEGISKLRGALKKEGIEWRFLKYHKNPPLLSTMFDLFIGALKTFSIIKSQNIKMVHVRGITPGIIMIMLSKLTRVKVLFDMRGLLAEEYVGGGMWKENSLQFALVKRAEKKLLMMADAVTVLTEKHMDLNKTLEYLANRNIPMEVIPCCVDTSKFNVNDHDKQDLRKKLGLKDRFILMYPGKLGSFYFVDEMVDFFNCMLTIIPEAIFFVITRDDPAIIMDRAKALNIPKDKIVIKTNVSFDEMPSYMRIADAGIFFINPYKKFGSSPIKMGEFLASGVPVIINPGVGDTEKFMRSSKVGVVVDKFNGEGYKRATEGLLRLKSEGAGLKVRCRQTAEKYLSKEIAVSKYLSIYRSFAV